MIEIGVLITVIVNICLFFYGYGKLTQRVNDTNRRLDNDIKHRFDQIDSRLDRIEQRLDGFSKN